MFFLCVHRAASVESVDRGHSPLSPLPSPLGLLKGNSVFSSPAPEERGNRQQIHAPVPFRPLPIQTGRLPWPLSDSTDWVTVTSPASGLTSIALHPCQTQISGSPTLRVPKPYPPINGLLSRPHGPSPSGVLLWLDRPSHRSLSEHVESREKRVSGGEAVTAPPQWSASAPQPERIFGENLREEEEEEAPLDLSESGRSKSKDQEKTQSQSDTSSSSYSPPAPLSSSSQYLSSPQSDPQAADNNTQVHSVAF